MKFPLLTTAVLAASMGVAQAAVINEASTNHDFGSADYPLFVELFGTAGESLDGKSLVMVSQNSTDGVGTIILTVDLNGNSIGSNGFFLVGNDDAALDRDTADIFGVTPDIALTGLAPAPINLARSQAWLLMDTANIPNSGAGPFAGGETVEDGFDFLGDARDASPLSWTNVPEIASDAGFMIAGFRRNTDGADSNAAGDITAYQYVTGNVTAPSDITTGSTTADPTAATTASVSDWMMLD